MLFSFSAGLLVAIVVDLLLGGKEDIAAAIPAVATASILLVTGWGVKAEIWLDSVFEDKRNRIPIFIIIMSIVMGVLGLAYYTR